MSTPSRNKEVIVNDDMLSYFTLVNTWGPGQCITILGLAVNILNIITFVKQGLRDSVNVSLLCLTISDFGSLAFHFFVNLCWTPPILKLDLPFYPQQIGYFLDWGNFIFNRVTTGTTAWIAFERCLCIVAPMKVKSIVTSRRTITFICVLYFIMMASVAPMFYTSRFMWIFDPRRNKSVIGFIKIANRGKTEGIVYLLNNILPTIFLILIVVLTTVLLKALQRNAKLRLQTTSSKQTNVISSRDARVVKMVVIISTVFIFCYSPSAVFLVVVLVTPDIRFDGSQKNLMFAIISVLSQLEAINASVNFFIYLKMSSKFRVAFREIICPRQLRQNEKAS